MISGLNKYADTGVLQLQKNNVACTINTPARPCQGPSDNLSDDEQDDSDSDDDDFARANALLGLGPVARSAKNRSLQAEVSAYLLEPLERHGCDIVRFWQVSFTAVLQLVLISHHYQENHLRYPTIYCLAMDILPIQGSAIPCECVFSSAKETMTDHCNQIHFELMEALQMVKFSVKRGRPLNFTECTLKQDELQLMERLVSEQTAVPDDLNEYISSLLHQVVEEENDEGVEARLAA